MCLKKKNVKDIELKGNVVQKRIKKISLTPLKAMNLKAHPHAHHITEKKSCGGNAVVTTQILQ